MAFDKLLADVSGFVGEATGSAGSATKGGSGLLGPLPWANQPKSTFWPAIDIDPRRWNRLYPYRLVVIDIKNPSKIVGGGSGGTLANKKSKIEKADGGIEYVLTQEIQNGSWEFNLPITPQQLSITDQYAITTTATMRGVVEEHNGVKFKIINAQGSMGIWSQRPTIGGYPRSASSLGSIFGGTLNQFNNVLSDAGRTARAFAGQHPAQATEAVSPGNHESTLLSTGYYQMLLLGQFLERYAEAKKDPKNKDWRLVFDVPKQNQSFIVSPVVCALEQNQQKPMESLWRFQLKAWKRIQLDSPAFAAQKLPSLDANNFQRILGTIREARRTLGSSINLLKAVRGDFQAPLNILRQTALLIKDFGGVALTAADLPRQIINDFQSSIKDSLTLASNAFERGPDGGNIGTSATGVTASGLRASSQQAKAGNAINLIVSQKNKNEGLSEDAVLSGALGLDASQSLQTDGTNNIFQNPEEYYDLFDAASVDGLNINAEQQDLIEDEVESVRLITVDDLQIFKQQIKSLTYDISDNFGAGDANYARINGLPEPKVRITPMSIEENEILASLVEVIQSYDLLTSTTTFDDNRKSNPLAFVGGLANESGIDFDVTESKLLVPVPFGLNIEQIAARYLENPDKWVEIATINKLQSPYIDEEGFSYTLLSNGDGRQINVDDSGKRLFIGQKVLLFSNLTPQFARKIIDIERINDINYLISFDGEDNLDILKTSDNAKLTAYLPGTVNSQNQIYIPVDETSQPDDRIKTPNHLDEDVLTRISKIDFLLTDDMDIAINQLGDFRFSNGLTNLIQAMKLKILTKKGTLLRHLDYGLGLRAGISIADVEGGAIIDSLNKMVQDDPRFNGIERIEVKVNGPTLSIGMAVTLANGSGVVPITFNV